MLIEDEILVQPPAVDDADFAKADADADRNDCCLRMTLCCTAGEVLQAQPWLHGLSEAGSSPCHRRVPIPGSHIDQIR